MRIGWALAALLLTATQARAEKDFCADRPGKATPACTLDAGKVQVEASLTDWSRSRDDETVEDELLFGDLLVRFGLTDSTELRAGWSAFGVDRQRDRATGLVDRRRGTGDVTLGLRQSLREAEGDHGVAVSLLPFVSLPVGRTPVGAGTWGAGVVVPAQVTLSKDWSITVDPEVDAAPNESGAGRHLAYAMAAALSWNAAPALQLSGEGWVRRDQDPGAHETQASLDATAAYQLGKNAQIDLAAYKGLNHATPQWQLLLGVARRF